MSFKLTIWRLSSKMIPHPTLTDSTKWTRRETQCFKGPGGIGKTCDNYSFMFFCCFILIFSLKYFVSLEFCQLGEVREEHHLGHLHVPEVEHPRVTIRMMMRRMRGYKDRLKLWGKSVRWEYCMISGITKGTYSLLLHISRVQPNLDNSQKSKKGLKMTFKGSANHLFSWSICT